jgi:hypothetical protein
MTLMFGAPSSKIRLQVIGDSSDETAVLVIYVTGMKVSFEYGHLAISEVRKIHERLLAGFGVEADC